MSRDKMPSSLPSLIERRGLLFGKESLKADHRSLAERYFESGRVADALEFFDKAGDPDGIEKVRRLAVETGDAFLVAQVERLGRSEIDRDVWLETARNAEKNGKLFFARQAYEKAGDEEAMARLDGETEPSE